MAKYSDQEIRIRIIKKNLSLDQRFRPEIFLIIPNSCAENKWSFFNFQNKLCFGVRKARIRIQKETNDWILTTYNWTKLS